MAETIAFTILGEPVSLKNRRPIHRNRRTGKPFSGKSDKLKRYEADFFAQVPPDAKIGLEKDVRVEIRAFYASRRPDLDVSVILDLLQNCGCIVNDRQVKELHAYHGVDRGNPRSIIKIEVIE